MAKKIVIAGPPHSGKSIMREGLKQAIRAIPGAPYPLFITACPDGEGSWFQETVNHNPELASRCKADYKGQFTPEFVKRIVESVKNCVQELTLIDIGGRTSPENEQICSGATHIVILAGDMSKVPEWEEFTRRVGLIVVSVIYSDYNGKGDEVMGVGSDGILRGSVHHLERGEDVSRRPMIVSLARHLVEM